MVLHRARFWGSAIFAVFPGLFTGPAGAQEAAPPPPPALVYCSCLCAGAEGNIECAIPIPNESAVSYYNGLVNYHAFGPNAPLKMVSECAQPKVCQRPNTAVDLSGQHVTSRPLWGSATMVLDAIVNNTVPPYKVGDTIDIIGSASSVPNALFLFPATEPPPNSP
jgi:hypothetical protein